MEERVVVKLYKIIQHVSSQKNHFHRRNYATTVCLAKKEDMPNLSKYLPINMISYLICLSAFYKAINISLILKLNFKQPRKHSGFRAWYKKHNHFQVIKLLSVRRFSEGF